MDSPDLDLVAFGSSVVELADQVQVCCHRYPVRLADPHSVAEDEKWHIVLGFLVPMSQNHCQRAGLRAHMHHSSCTRHVHSKQNNHSVRSWLPSDWGLGWKRVLETESVPGPLGLVD